MSDRPIDRSADRPIDGVLIVDKPAGPTSHDVVAIARRALREKRIGHTGTLDPLATGVLPLVIGKATRLASRLSAAEKEYEAAIRLGAVSDTYDAEGTIERVAAGAGSPDLADLEAAMQAFRGSFDQVPPPYSAKKVGGVPAYKLARRQQATELAAVRVTVHRLDLLQFDGEVIRLRIRTSPGFYVRSLAHDLGARLGCGGYLEALRRTASGQFRVEQAVSLAELQRDPEAARAGAVCLEDLVTDLPAVRLTERGARRVAHGNFVDFQHLADMVRAPVSGPVRMIDGEGRLLAIAEPAADGVLRPSIVLV